MDNATKGNFIRGTLDLLMLRLLMDKDYYGYQLAELIHEKSKSILKIPAGTLYPLLYRLEEKGCVSARREIVEKNNRVRMYYHLEPEGKKYYENLLNDYELIGKGIQNILYSD